jgi:hypothetical protein
MEKYKDWLITFLIITGIILAYFAFKNPKEVIKTVTVTKVETKEVIKYITSNSTITGGTSATITPGGATAVSGANLTITNTTTVTQTSTTTVTIAKKEVEERIYSMNSLTIGAETLGLLKNYGAYVDLKIDVYDFSATYYFKEPEFTARAGIVILQWR